ncbi:MAG TPA: hypothetical protein VGF69_09575 [Thermoanaerobaculia bacterium]|jgi:hypothetical protein
MRNVILLVCLTLVAADLCHAQTQRYQPERRQHFLVEYKPAKLAYRVTKISQRPNETETRDFYLVEDSTGDRLLLTDRRDFLKQTSEHEVLDLSTKELLRSVVQYPYKSATLRETLEELRNGPKHDDSTFMLTMELNGVSATAKLGAWSSGTERDALSSLRRSATAQFIERVERLRPLIGRGELAMFCVSLFEFFLYQQSCGGASAPFQPAVPDCDFDAEFDFPCSDQQKQKISAAKIDGKDLAGLRY